jgi:hypothetical protein
MTSNTKFARFGALLAASLFAAALPASYGCAALRAENAASTEELLATAGFQKRQADSAGQARNLASMAPFQFVVRGKAATPPWTLDVSCWNAICG